MHINTRKKKCLMVLMTVLILAMAFSMNASATDAVIGKINSLKKVIAGIIMVFGSQIINSLGG